MSPENNKKLLNKFPELYLCLRRKSFECGDGWFDMIYEMSEKLQAIFDEKGACPEHAPKGEECEDYYVGFTIVKEKYGGLRLQGSVGINIDGVRDLIDEYENKSLVTCETCGNPCKAYAEPVAEGPMAWIETICERCKKERKLKSLLK